MSAPSLTAQRRRERSRRIHTAARSPWRSGSGSTDHPRLSELVHRAPRTPGPAWASRVGHEREALTTPLLPSAASSCHLFQDQPYCTPFPGWPPAVQMPTCDTAKRPYGPRSPCWVARLGQAVAQPCCPLFWVGPLVRILLCQLQHQDSGCEGSN